MGDICTAEAGGFLPLEMFLGSYGAAGAAVPLPPAVGCREELALALGVKARLVWGDLVPSRDLGR